MYKLLATVPTLLVSSSIYAATNTETQKWECALNLHQGDSGTLSIERAGDEMTGVISVTRNENVFENEVSGRWAGNEINVKRLLDSNDSESMTGIVVKTGTKSAKIGGRFSANYQGVWSADCDLVSASQAKQDNSSATNSETEPSTNSIVSPNSPNSRDRIKFSANASHPDGVKSISFFLGKNEIHTCSSSECSFSYGPISPGKYKWYVEATSESGVKNSERVNELLVTAAPTKNNCTISGTATGTAAELSSIYLVTLFGPDNNVLRESKEFLNGLYSFNNLPKGIYTLKVDTRSDKSVLATPSTTTANCQTKDNITIDFDFR